MFLQGGSQGNRTRATQASPPRVIPTPAPTGTKGPPKGRHKIPTCVKDPAGVRSSPTICIKPSWEVRQEAGGAVGARVVYVGMGGP